MHAVRGRDDTGSLAMINSDVLDRVSLQAGAHPLRHGDWVGATLDFGVREGYRAAYGLEAQPSLHALREYGERWAPYRSTAALYLWRAAEEARQARRQAARP